MAEATAVVQQGQARCLPGDFSVNCPKGMQGRVVPVCILCRSRTQGASRTRLRSSLSDDNRPGLNSGVKLERTRNVLESVFHMSAVENPRDPTSGEAAEPTGLKASAPATLQQSSGSSCTWCDSEGSVECLTCAGSGLYVEPCLESHGVIVKVTCLGCGGSGRTLCPHCGGHRRV